MRFTGVREVQAPVDVVWAGLHDGDVLRTAIPGCERLAPAGLDRYAATLAVKVGPLTDTYRGDFAIEDLGPQELRVEVSGRGRCGGLEVDLRVSLDGADRPGTTMLSYEAHAQVRGLVSRLGSATLTVAGGHLTGCFFRDLDRFLRTTTRGVRRPSLVDV